MEAMDGDRTVCVSLRGRGHFCVSKMTLKTLCVYHVVGMKHDGTAAIKGLSGINKYQHEPSIIRYKQ